MPRKADPEYSTQVYKPQITPIETQTPTASSSAQMVQEKYDSFLVPKDLQ